MATFSGDALESTGAGLEVLNNGDIVRATFCVLLFFVILLHKVVRIVLRAMLPRYEENDDGCEDLQQSDVSSSDPA